jgi:hypothetical protein
VGVSLAAFGEFGAIVSQISSTKTTADAIHESAGHGRVPRGHLAGGGYHSDYYCSLTHPAQTFTHDLTGYFVTSVKLPESHFIPTRFQVIGNSAAASVDWQDAVARSM